MPSKLESRLAVLERRQHHGGPMVVVIRGGVTAGGDPTDAHAGKLRFERGDGESFQGFLARAVTEAKTAGERLVIIGGLPQ